MPEYLRWGAGEGQHLVAVEYIAGSSEALTMERRSRKADGLARSRSSAGGINETRNYGGICPLAAAVVLLYALEPEGTESCCAETGLGPWHSTLFR